MKVETLGELKSSNYRSRTIREELRQNLIAALENKDPLFSGIIGYEHTVIPAIQNAILSKHDILLLGLRGQAKTRIMRSLVHFLDEWIPAIKGSSLCEDPFAPITTKSKQVLDELGDDTPIEWIHRSQRFHEKLATPDVSMSDLIGDIDPIKASRDKLDLSDEGVIHYGLIPRSNRSLFLINEIPDLQGRIQVGLLNILEEKDIQIRGFPLRLPLDLTFLFTANPEDYTNRGNIITPLKDRISSQIITHYPQNRATAIEVTKQEADVDRKFSIPIPNVYRELIEEIAIQARQSEHVDQTSGVSARLSISALELLASNSERRCLINGDPPHIRFADLIATIPAICGKIELVYEGEQEGANIISEKIIGKAVKKVFTQYFPPVLQTKNEKNQKTHPSYDIIQKWFASGNVLEISDDLSFEQELEQLNKVDGLAELLAETHEKLNAEEKCAWMSFIIEGLHQYSILSREGHGGAWIYGDMFRQMLGDLN